MGYSIELYFDRRFEEKLRLLWDDLERAGKPSILQKIGSRPHLSLLILENCKIHHVSDLIDIGIKGRSQFFISFPAISLIPGEQQTVFLTPVINLDLIKIQQSLYTLLAENDCCIQENYKPHNWFPHCTISKELSHDEAMETLAICQNRAPIGEALITEVGFIEFRPRKLINTFSLMDNVNRYSHNQSVEGTR